MQNSNEIETNEQENKPNQTSLMISGGTMGAGPVEIKEIATSKIKLARNSRMDVRDEELAGLMQSIKEVGLLQPIGVVRSKTGGFEVIYGNRRFLALSKLGKTKVPAIVHSHKTAVENDLKNLTENLQRRNITLMEAGRYIKLLMEQGLNQAEIAVRLGITKGYVSNCSSAYDEVPKEFQRDIILRKQGDTKKENGKIAMQTVRAILSAGRQRGITKDIEKELFHLAKTDDKFNHRNASKYAHAILNGEKEPIKKVKSTRKIQVQFWIDESEWEELNYKYVVKGPFKTVNGFFNSVLTGEKTYKVKTLKA